MNQLYMKQNITLCFAVRDCSPFLKRIFDNIQSLREETKDTYNLYCVFVYDVNRDDSEQKIEDYKALFPNHVYTKKIINIHRFKTVRIANARNECLRIMNEHIKHVKYHLMIDADNVCVDNWDTKRIHDYMNGVYGDDWGCMSFNRKRYYDIWALLYRPYIHHCWGYGSESRKIVNIMMRDITIRLRECKENQLEVLSAFNGFAIYRTECFHGLSYDGLYENTKKRISTEDRLETFRVLKEKHQLDIPIEKSRDKEGWFNDACCEHIPYHLDAVKRGHKIMISKHSLFI